MSHDFRTYIRDVLPWVAWTSLAWTLVVLAVIGLEGGFSEAVAGDWGVSLWLPSALGAVCWLATRI